MMEFLGRLEQLPFFMWVLQSGSIWAYPTILTVHTIGMGILAGVTAIINMRLLGVGSTVPIKPLERLYPLMWFGFWVNLVTGSVLLIADATTKLINPDFYVKMVFVILGVVTLKVMRTRVFGDPDLDKAPVSGSAKGLALASLVCWLGAITAGRLLAYLGPVSGVPGLQNH